MLKASLQSIFLISALSFFNKKRIPPQMKFSELQFKINSLIKKSGLISFCPLKKSVFSTKSVFYILFTLFFSLYSSNSFSQDTIPRKKIGLVLTGGGAKGFAHIGVLKVLESAGIKIDYIGGTSMGAVVGGLYASGYNAKQLDSIFSNTNFDELLQDYIPRTSKSFFEKRNDELYALSLPFNKFSIGIPLSLSKGLYNYSLLTRLTHIVRHVRDFNQLPIPFLCIATNIETGEQELLNSGYLPQALLASSSFPTLFSPVEINGKMLVDGGVVNNYPIDEVKKLGADIIIGVDVQDGLKDRNSLKEATRILVQISNLSMIEGMKDKVKRTDIYIKPEVENYSVISFDKGKEIIKKGEEAAFQVFEQLKQVAEKDGSYKRPDLKCIKDSIVINKITINSLKNYTRAYVIGQLEFKEKTKIGYDDLIKGVNKLNSSGNFNSISYQINPYTTGDELSLSLTENNNKTFLKFGLHYDGLYKSAVLVNLTHKKSLFKNDVLSLDLALGDNFRYSLDYYIDNGFYFSFGFKSSFNQFNRNISTSFGNGIFNQEGINTINVDYSDFTNQAYLQTIFAQKFLLGAGVEFKHLKVESKTLQNTEAIFENSDYTSVFAYLKYDSFDNKYFPKRGWYFNGDIQSYLFSTNFTNQFNRFSIVKGDAGFAKKLFKRATFKLQSEAGFAVGEQSVSTLDFVLGGYGFNSINNFRHFYGYDFISISGNSYIKSMATVDYEFYKKNHLNFSANYANVDNRLFSTGNWISSPEFSGYALGYGLETVIGPIEMKYSWSPELPKGFLWFGVGFWF